MMPGQGLKKTVLLWVTAWAVSITTLHAWLNLNLFRRSEAAPSQFKVGFLPVT